MKMTLRFIVLALVLLISCMLMFTACDSYVSSETLGEGTSTDTSSEPDTDAHVHSFGEWYTTKEPTCSQEGKQERSCSCGQKETKSLEKLAHTEVTDEATVPSCTETGLTEGKHCSVCNTVIVPQQTVPTSAHQYSKGYCVYCSQEKPNTDLWTTYCSPDANGEDPIPGYNYTSDGFHMISADFTGKTPYATIQSKDPFNIQKGIYLELRVDDFSYAGTFGADHWISFHIWDSKNIQPGNSSDYGSGWLSLIRTNSTRQTIQSITSSPDKFAQHGGFTNISPTVDSNGNYIYTFEIRYTGSGYTILICGVEVQGLSQISSHLNSLNSEGEFYIGVTFNSMVMNGVCEATILKFGNTKENAAAPRGTEEVAPVVPFPHVHIEQIIPEIPPKCNQLGYTEGLLCTSCNKTLIEPEPIPMVGHTEQILSASDPTCTQVGYTEGVICSSCHTVLVAQERLPATGHTEQIVYGYEPTCTQNGYTDGVICSTCNKPIIAQKYIAAKGHTVQTLPGIRPTKTQTGLTEGSKCTTCNSILVKQEVIPTLLDKPYFEIWSGSVATSFEGGSGTKNDPYLIATGEQLAFLAKEINDNNNNIYYDKYYKLTNSIDLNGLEWNPIGCYFYGSSYGSNSDSRTFAGHFDGDGFEIINFKITKPKNYYYRYLGLFGMIKGGTVENLGVRDFAITINQTEIAIIGGLAGVLKGTVENCYAIGSATAKAKRSNEDYASIFIGGLIGYIENSTVKGSYTSCVVSASAAGGTQYNGYSTAGGLVGWSEHSSIEDCYATSSVSASASGNYSYAYSGGLVGDSDGGFIVNCYAKGDVNASGSISGYTLVYAYAGGLVGESSGSISNCYATGRANASTSGSNSYNSQSYAGGLIGKKTGETIINCYATGNATASASGGSYCDADSYAGGLAGLSSAEATIKNCYATGDATASSSGIRTQAYASGLVGRSGSSALTNNYRYDGQRIQVNGDSKPTNTAGTAVTIEQLNDPSFYTDMLGWGSTFWDLTDLDFKKGKHPTFLE